MQGAVSFAEIRELVDDHEELLVNAPLKKHLKRVMKIRLSCRSILREGSRDGPIEPFEVSGNESLLTDDIDVLLVLAELIEERCFPGAAAAVHHAEVKAVFCIAAA